MKGQEAISLNIAILPDAERKNKSIELSRKVAAEIPSYFVLDGESLHPHFTVYQAHYPLRNLDKLKKAVDEIAQRLSGLEITMDSFRVVLGTFIFWGCEKTGELINAQSGAIGLANPLREGLIMPQLMDREGLTDEDRGDIKNFGSLLIGPRYDPHITITRIKNPNDAERTIEVLGEARRETFRPESLCLARFA